MSREIDISCLFDPSITFQEVENLIKSSEDLEVLIFKLSAFLKSENSSRISFQAYAHLGFLFSRLQEKELADYISNAVFNEILLANNDRLQSMRALLNDWGNVDSSEYAYKYSSCLDLRQTNQIPLVENIDQVTYLGESKIDDVVKVQIAFETGPIEASAIIKETEDKPEAKEIIMYMEKSYPRFYGVLSNVLIQNKPCRLTFFDQHSETFKQNLIAFYKLPKSKRADMKNERETLALNFYQQLIVELNTYRACELFHNNVCPSNILIYNNIETSGEPRVFLFNGKCMKFKLVDNVENSFPLNLDFENRNRRYIAPEIVNRQDYNMKHEADYKDFNYNVSDAWSLAACILNFITDTSADKWNSLGFAQSLNKIIKDISNERLKDILLESLKHDISQRLMFNEAFRYFD